jgi:hypothetical protein
MMRTRARVEAETGAKKPQPQAPPLQRGGPRPHPGSSDCRSGAGRPPAPGSGPRAQLLYQQRILGNRSVQKTVASGIPGELRPLRTRQRVSLTEKELLHRDSRALPDLAPKPETAAASPAPPSLAPSAASAARALPAGALLRAARAGQGRPGKRGGAPGIQGAWYNISIPFTDYQFDPSLAGIKTAAGLAKDVAVEGLEWIVDKIKGLVNSGIEWLKEKWQGIQDFAASAFDTLKNSFTNIVGFLKSPFSFLADAIMNFDADALAKGWSKLTGMVSSVTKGFQQLAGKLLDAATGLWSTIGGFAGSLLNKLAGLTDSWVFQRLPGALQDIAYAAINKVKALWKLISDGWNQIWSKLKAWLESALQAVAGFVQKVLSFAIGELIDKIRLFGKVILFLRDLFNNPDKYIAILAQKGAAALEGLEDRFAGVVGQYFGSSAAPVAAPVAATAKAAATATTAAPTAVQRQPAAGSAAAAKRTATWSEIGSGIWEVMKKKWGEFKSNPMAVLTGLLLDMVLPIVGNIKDVIQLFTDIKAIVTAPLSADSLHDFWTSLLKLLDIPILIYNTVVSILMRTLMVPLIVASFIPHPLVKAIAAAVGYTLLGAFVTGEVMNIEHKILLLKTGLTNKQEKEGAYNRVADSLIAMALTAVVILVMLILHFMANLVKGVFNFVKAKVFRIEPPKVEAKVPEGEAKGTKPVEAEGEGKGTKAGEPTSLKGELGSLDGQRSIKVTEQGRIWICASPCEEIRLKYQAEIKDNPGFEERIKQLEEGYPDLSEADKAARDAQIKQFEQELADFRTAREGGVRVPRVKQWPPDPPSGPKPAIDAPNAAEWRYQRYLYKKFLKGVTDPEKVLQPDEWYRRHFEPSQKGGRPGRPGGEEQVTAKKKLAAEGIRIVENVELGGRFPDGIDPKPNAAGGRNYYEVGKMLKSGIPEARERVKIADEIKAMGPGDTVTFVDKTDVTKRVTYAKGSTPEAPTSQTF